MARDHNTRDGRVDVACTPIPALNAMLEHIKDGFSKFGRTKLEKLEKLERMGKDPYDKDELIRILSCEYQKQYDVIRQLRKEKNEVEDILQEYEPCDYHTVNKVLYHFDYPTQTLWNDRTKTIKCGKYHRNTGTYTMYATVAC